MRIEPAIGAVFGKWTVIAAAENRGKLKQWLCRCVCGMERLVVGTNLRRGRSAGCEMCGPLRSGTAAIKHGASATPEYKIWLGMRRRCESPNAPRYEYYGGRGISVCERWQQFEKFLEDIGPRPSAQHSLDRYPDNGGNYEPGNCRWATKEQQANNKSSNRPITHQGVTKNFAEWATATGIPRTVLVAWIDRDGWPIARALTEPVIQSTDRERGAEGRFQ